MKWCWCWSWSWCKACGGPTVSPEVGSVWCVPACVGWVHELLLTACVAARSPTLVSLPPLTHPPLLLLLLLLLLVA